MTILADYRVLQDRKTLLRAAAAGGPATLTLSFTLPGVESPPDPNPFTDIGLAAPPAHLPVLQFVLDTINPRNLRFQIETNNPTDGTVLQFTATYNSDVFHTVHEVINLDTLEPGPNSIRFTVVSGTGLLGIDDVVLWFKRTVTVFEPGVD